MKAAIIYQHLPNWKIFRCVCRITRQFRRDPHLRPESLADCIWLTFIVEGETTYERCQYYKTHGEGRPGLQPGCWVSIRGKYNKGRKDEVGQKVLVGLRAIEKN